MNTQLITSAGYWTTYCFLFGLITGSFLNVCIHRLPIGESIVASRSRCPFCKKKINAWDNIPVLSFFIIKRKCRNCDTPISWTYPTVEILTGLFMVGTYLKFGLTLETAIFSITLAALIVISVIDIQHQIIPDRITLPGILFGVAAGVYLNGLKPTFIGLFLGSSLFYTLAVLSRGGMGGGDIKFIAGTGALLGWEKVLLVIFLGAFLGTIYSVPLILLGKKGRKSPMPFGPFLAMGAALTIFIGNELISLYLKFMGVTI